MYNFVYLPNKVNQSFIIVAKLYIKKYHQHAWYIPVGMRGYCCERRNIVAYTKNKVSESLT